MTELLRLRYSMLAIVALLAACGRPPMPATYLGGGELPAVRVSSGSASKIQHVILVVQENRSFDNFFATYPGADGATSGLCTRNGKTTTVPLRKVDLVSRIGEPPYAWSNFQTEYDGGKMDGFCNDLYGGTLPVHLAYQYVNPKQIAPLWTIAKRYILADHMFQTQQSGSFTAHQDLIRGDTVWNRRQSVIDNPSVPGSYAIWGCAAPKGTVTHLLSRTHVYQPKGPFPCFTWKTLRDELDAKGVSWKYYTPAAYPSLTSGNLWDAFFAIQNVYGGSEWKTNVTNRSPYEKTIFSDLKRGKLAAVSWVVPDFVNSDHPGQSGDTGPSWVAQVVNAVGKSPYWNSTAIVIVWDDWGGWYDNVKPPQLYYDGLSFRVPCLIVSPYAKPGYVSHTQYEFASILRFVEDNWGLGRLGPHDRNANSIADVFDFTKSARRFHTIPAKYSREFFEHQPESYEPVDDR
jgi:phospholipase C